MTMGILVRRKEDILKYFKYGQIHQSIEIKKHSKDYKVKIKIIDLYTKENFKELKTKIDIIYDKCHSQKDKEREKLRKLHKYCKKNKIPIFNDYNLIMAVGNKWRLDGFLKGKKNIKKYIIPTFLYSEKNASRLISKYKTIILKPAWGQEGKGIIEIKKEKDLLLANYIKKENNSFKIESKEIKEFPDINFLIKKVWRNKNYIIQPKINSAKFKDRIFDIRLVLQKSGKWNISGMGARVAKRGSFLCNIASGGEIFDGEYVIKGVFKEKSKKIIKEIKEISTKIGEILEKRINGIVSELGFDFIIDKKGKIWLLEINSKPSSEIFYKKSMKKMRKKMTLWPIFFAKNYYENKKN